MLYKAVTFCKKNAFNLLKFVQADKQVWKILGNNLRGAKCSSYSKTMIANKRKNFKAARWLPADRKVINDWCGKRLNKLKVKRKEQFDKMNEYFPHYEKADEEISHMQNVDRKILLTNLQLHPSVAELLLAIKNDPAIYMSYHNMYTQQADHAPEGGIYVKTWQEGILLINDCVNSAPEYDSDVLIPVPMNAILNLPMATSSGHQLFLNDKVNVLFKNILNEWGQYLMSKYSTDVLVDSATEPGGWFSSEALVAMPDFENTYICAPDEPFYGYTSFDDFFVRKLKEGARPVEDADDQSVIVSACEAAPLKIAYDVKEYDSFWIKEQNYSMEFILNRNPLATAFYGGTVYQGFLSPTTYHRFHSPVDGYIYDIEMVEGTYFSQPYFKDENLLFNEAQQYMCHICTRAIYWIKADNPDIGLMAFIALGISDVSTVEATVKKGDRVKKGQETGMFHFGGSSHLLVFRKGVNVVFDDDVVPGMSAANIEVNARIAKVSAPTKK